LTSLGRIDVNARSPNASLKSIEIDALPPAVVNGLLTRAINDVIDHDAWAATAAREQLERQHWRAGNERLRGWFEQQGWL
jgi:hypothetical protein